MSRASKPSRGPIPLGAQTSKKDKGHRGGRVGGGGPWRARLPRARKKTGQRVLKKFSLSLSLLCQCMVGVLWWLCLCCAWRPSVAEGPPGSKHRRAIIFYTYFFFPFPFLPPPRGGAPSFLLLSSLSAARRFVSSRPFASPRSRPTGAAEEATDRSRLLKRAARGSAGKAGRSREDRRSGGRGRGIGRGFVQKGRGRGKGGGRIQKG
jgi:hypothetical protein